MTIKTCLLAIVAGFTLAGWSMPTRSDLKKVQATVNELMADDIAAMKSGKKTPADAAAKAMEYAEMANSEAARFLLYKGAFGLYVTGGKYDEAIGAINALTANVKDVPDKVLSEIVRDKLKRISKNDGGALFEYYARVDRRMRYGGEKAKLEKQLKANPSDKDARRALAQTQVALGDWTAALATFAALGGDEAKAAKAELGGKTVEAADFWWGYAVAGDEDLQDEFRAHAATLYAEAIKVGRINGLKKALAEKRMAEYAPKAAAAPQPAVAAIRAPEPKAETPSAPSASPAPVAPIVNGKPIILDLGGGEKLEMLFCPAGEFTMGYERTEIDFKNNLNHPHRVKISRPFYLAKYPLTAGQWKRIWPKYEIRCWRSKGEKRGRPFERDESVCLEDRNMIWKTAGELSKRFRRALPKGYVVRLPTEAEWEYALKAGGTDAFFSKKEYTFPELETIGAGPRRICQAHEVKRTDGRKPYIGGPFAAGPMPCGKYKPNRWGFHDMLGNVWEMTLDCAIFVQRKGPTGDAAKMPEGWFADATDPLCWLWEPGKLVEFVCCGGCGYVFPPRQEEMDPKRAAGFVNVAHRIPSGEQFRGLHIYRGFRLAIGPDLLTERNLPQPK